MNRSHEQSDAKIPFLTFPTPILPSFCHRCLFSSDTFLIQHPPSVSLGVQCCGSLPHISSDLFLFSHLLPSFITDSYKAS